MKMAAGEGYKGGGMMLAEEGPDKEESCIEGSHGQGRREGIHGEARCTLLPEEEEVSAIDREEYLTRK